MADIFDEIIQCIRQEQSANGTVYVSRDHLVEFYKNAAPAMQAQPAMQTRQYVQPSAPSRPPQRLQTVMPAVCAKPVTMWCLRTARSTPN